MSDENPIAPVTPETDVWAFSMTVVEVLLRQSVGNVNKYWRVIYILRYTVVSLPSCILTTTPLLSLLLQMVIGLVESITP